MSDAVTNPGRHEREISRLRARVSQGDPYWPAQLALLAAVGLGVFLSDGVRIGPVWVIPLAEFALLLALIGFGPRRADHDPGRKRIFALTIVGLIALSNLTSLALLVHHLIAGGVTNGERLILSGVIVWAKNVLIFAVLFWELDRGGPFRRYDNPKALPDFQFPQMENPQLTIPDWRPGFADYLYVSTTNATAFSPTDAMPMTLSAKAMMAVESLSSIMVIGLVVARAVNILG